MFFGGKVAAWVTISRGIGRGYADALPKRRSRLTGNNDEVPLPGSVGGGHGFDSGPQSISGGGSVGSAIGTPGGGMTGPGMPTGGPESSAGAMPGARADMPDIAGMDQDEATAYIKARVAVGSPLPPVTLHLRIENRSPAKVSVEVDDFNSDLGNFAVQPGTLTLLSRQVGEPEPMISQLGVTSDEIPVTVTLKMGDVKETRTILVRNLRRPAEPEK